MDARSWDVIARRKQDRHVDIVIAADPDQLGRGASELREQVRELLVAGSFDERQAFACRSDHPKARVEGGNCLAVAAYDEVEGALVPAEARARPPADQLRVARLHAIFAA